jgi:dipeptidyl aminopeptidase/acylaminoacyl peptidase
MALKTISDPQISPDGSKVAYVVRSANFRRKAYDAQIWVVSTSGGTPQPLKESHVSDGRPRWSRRGNQLAFVSRRDGRPQIYLVAPPDGQPRKLTASASGVGDFKWLPDDRHIGYLAVDAPSPEEKKRIPEGDDPIVANQGYRYSRLYQISTDGGPEQRLTIADRRVTSFDWAPDGQKVVYSGQNTPRNRDTFPCGSFRVGFIEPTGNHAGGSGRKGCGTVLLSGWTLGCVPLTGGKDQLFRRAACWARAVGRRRASIPDSQSSGRCVSRR